MLDSATHISDRLLRLLDRLGYTPASGWVSASLFGVSATHRFAMQKAEREMSVIGAFCLKGTPGPGENVATPLVYVANVADAADAQEVHRKVWSQGLVPFLLVASRDGIVLCPGFAYTQQDWNELVRWFSWPEIDRLPRNPLEPTVFGDSLAELRDLRAIRLRTSLFWRDHVINVDGRVDQRLLASLNALSNVLIRGVGVSRKLSPAAANALIGRFLYVFVLADRDIISQRWMSARGHSAIHLNQQNQDWPAAATWSFLDDLDSIFNGTIFPMGPHERAEIDESHINLVRRVMKHGAQPYPSGALQLSFIDFYLGALRTETLSAVYEQFLENMRAGERRRVGAFYTPPFLVDFILDRIEEVLPLRDGITILDPAAGSGVFLVAAYRRIIERARIERAVDMMSLNTLHELLCRNVFGIERNDDACHVAAFSLYLTMLDYADPHELDRVAAGKASEKLFPGLVGRNLHSVDFFSTRERLEGIPKVVDCILGNPPWQTLEKLNSPEANEWKERNTGEAPIGKNQAAELFTWKAIRDHLADGGVLGFLLPAKSFINSTSWNFRRQLASVYTMIGAANFAHLRYRLFASARQAGVAVFLRKELPTPRSKLWTYSPLSVAQPMARKACPWTILLDRAELQTFRQAHVAGDPRGWFEAFMLRPVDRQILNYLFDSATEGRIASLEGLCDSVGAGIRRGGSSGETGVDPAFLIDAPDDPVPATQLLREHGGGLLRLGSSPHDVALSLTQLANVKTAYRHRFGGNVLLVPRNFSNIRFVDHAIGYTSSTLGIFFEKPAERVTLREQQLLRAIAIYLRSPIALYLVATIGRRWLMDRRNIEPSDLAAFPVPFTGLDDPRIDDVLATNKSKLEEALIGMLGLKEDLSRAIREFLDFRIGFQDGDVPQKALLTPDSDTIHMYESTLGRNLDGLIGRPNAFTVSSHIDRNAGVGTVAAQFREKVPGRTERDASSASRAASVAYEQSSANSFSDSLAAEYDADVATVTFVKPLEFFRWTIDSAFADSRHMIDVFVTGKR